MESLEATMEQKLLMLLLSRELCIDYFFVMVHLKYLTFIVFISILLPRPYNKFDRLNEIFLEDISIRWHNKGAFVQACSFLVSVVCTYIFILFSNHSHTTAVADLECRQPDCTPRPLLWSLETL